MSNSQSEIQTKSKFSVTISTTYEFSSEDIDNLLCTAFEGGINYWCGKVTMKPANPTIDGNCFASNYISRGGTLILCDAESPDKWELDLEKMMKGIQMHCEQMKINPADLLDNHDAEDADCIVQYALFNEIVFG